MEVTVPSRAKRQPYSDEPKSAETRFLVLNNYLSLAWRDVHPWLEGLFPVLGEARARPTVSRSTERSTTSSCRSAPRARASAYRATYCCRIRTGHRSRKQIVAPDISDADEP